MKSEHVYPQVSFTQDQGTRDSGVPDYISLTTLWEETGIEGFNGDTMESIPFDFFDQMNRPIALEPEIGIFTHII